jgi:predicted  nucleic acid-binding Zn-ribbon protein
MREANLEERVTNLENHYQALTSLPGDVRALTDRMGVVESEIVQLRGEMRGEFSAIRVDIAEMRSDIAELRHSDASLHNDIAGLRNDMAGLRNDMAGLRNDMAGLRGEMLELRESMADNTRQLAGKILANQREMRLLHEEVLDRISRIGERGAPSAE